MFKAICSKNRVKIFEPKERGKPYRTIKLFSALELASEYFPEDIPWQAVGENIGRLVDYRNNVVHFYSVASLGVVIYGLAQTCIVNYRDIVLRIFDVDIASEVNIALLPLAFSAPPDPITFLGKGTGSPGPASEFLRLMYETTRELENENIDTARFFTVFEVSLQSTKKLESADIVAGVQDTGGSGLLLVSRKIDPNKSHPYSQKKVVEKLGGAVKGEAFTTYNFQSIIWKHEIKSNDRYCWPNKNTNTFQYAPELVTWIQQLTAESIREAKVEYGAHLKNAKKNGS